MVLVDCLVLFEAGVASAECGVGALLAGLVSTPLHIINRDMRILLSFIQPPIVLWRVKLIQITRPVARVYCIVLNVFVHFQKFNNTNFGVQFDK